MTLERPVPRREGSLGLAYHFASAYLGRTLLLVGLLVLSGLAEGVGVATMLPLLEIAGGADASSQSALSRLVGDGLHAVGLQPTLGVLLGLIVIGMTLKAGFHLLAMKQVGYTVARVSTDLRLKLLNALFRTRWGYFVSQPSGRFANAVAGEADRAAGAYRSVCSVIATTIQAGIYGVLAVFVSWRIALFGIVAGLAVVLVLSRLVSVAREAGRAQTTITSSLISHLTDVLQGIKPIKAMGREDYLRPLLEHETHGINRAKEKQVLASEALKAAQEPILVVLLAVALFVALTVTNQSFASVLVTGFLFYRLAGRISVTQMEFQSIAIGESAFWSMQDGIEEAERQREQTRGGVEPPQLARELRLEDVRFSYGQKAVLEGISVSIPAGSFSAIIGPSGAGKTTIVDLVVGLYRPDSGRVLVDGIDLTEVDLDLWRRQIGYVPQEMFLFHDTVLENVTLGDPALPREQVETALRASGAWDFVAELPEGLETILGERGTRLSGGQRQRVAIARALVSAPRLLVLDEVTTSLDPATEREILATLRKLDGVTVLAISHQPALREAADVVFEIRDGRIREVERVEADSLAAS